MTHDKVMGCHMAPQKCETWHKKEWLTISHVWEMIPWLILSHAVYDVIKGNKEIREKNKKLIATQMVRGKREEISSFDRMCGVLKKGGESAKRKEKMKGK